jgi:hypothetical protein
MLESAVVPNLMTIAMVTELPIVLISAQWTAIKRILEFVAAKLLT